MCWCYRSDYSGHSCITLYYRCAPGSGLNGLGGNSDGICKPCNTPDANTGITAQTTIQASDGITCVGSRVLATDDNGPNAAGSGCKVREVIDGTARVCRKRCPNSNAAPNPNTGLCTRCTGTTNPIVAKDGLSCIAACPAGQIIGCGFQSSANNCASSTITVNTNPAALLVANGGAAQTCI